MNKPDWPQHSSASPQPLVAPNTFSVMGLQKPTARQTLGFMASPFAEIFEAFVRLIASVFALYGLFPKSHPALYATRHRLKFGDVIATAWRNLRWHTQGATQILLFFGIVSTLAMSALTLVFAAFSLFIGDAYAAGFTNVGNNFFDFPTSNDWSKAVLEYLFLAQPMPPGVTSMPQNSAVQAGLRAIFAFYSNAMLVVAAVIMLYHLVAMVAHTAQQGVPMGQRANQIWAPIRLVVAIGLLVPVGGALSSGQHIVLQAAGWGAGLASQTWKTFVGTMRTDVESWFLQKPQTYDVAPLFHALLRAETCMEKWNIEVYEPTSNGGKALPNPSKSRPGKDANEVSEKVFAVNDSVPDPTNDYGLTDVPVSTRVLYGDDAHNQCGGYAFPLAPPVPTGPRNAGALAAQAIYQAQQAAFKIARDKIRSKNLALKNACFDSQLSPSSAKCQAIGVDRNTLNMNNQDVTDAIQDYQQDLNAKLQAAVTAVGSTLGSTRVYDILSLADTEGWMTAGSLFNAISREQAWITGAMTSGVPIVYEPNMRAMSSPSAYLAMAGQVSTYNRLKNSVISLVSGEQTESARSAAGWAVSGADSRSVEAKRLALVDAEGHDPSSITSDVFEIIDMALQKFGVWGPGQFLGVKFDNTSNPLVELTGWGQKWVNFGLKCIAAAIGMNVVDAVTELGAGSTKKLARGGNILGDFVGMLGSFTMPVGIAALFIGFMLAFLVPLLPFLKFFFNILTWVLSVFEAMVAVPLLALAHLSPEGEGLPGPASTGYYFIFNIFLRPALMVFGLIAGLLVFIVAATFLNGMFEVTVADTGAGAGAAMVLAKLVFTVFYVVLMYICANTSFKAIDYFPAQALSWFGRSKHTESLGNQHLMSQAASFGIASAGAHAITGGLGKLSNPKGMMNAGKKGLGGGGRGEGQGVLDYWKNGTQNKGVLGSAETPMHTTGQIGLGNNVPLSNYGGHSGPGGGSTGMPPGMSGGPMPGGGGGGMPPGMGGGGAGMPPGMGGSSMPGGGGGGMPPVGGPSPSGGSFNMNQAFGATTAHLGHGVKISRAAEELSQQLNLAGKEQAYGLHPGMMTGLLAAESQGDLTAMSHKGAAGPFQFMEATAERFGVHNRFDPHQASEGAAKYLSFLSNRYDGDPAKALAGYNAGEGSVDRAIDKATKAGNAGDWLSYLPRETQDYVAKIMPHVDTNWVAPPGSGVGGGDYASSGDAQQDQGGSWASNLMASIMTGAAMRGSKSDEDEENKDKNNAPTQPA